jgi:hypothetical protein
VTGPDGDGVAGPDDAAVGGTGVTGEADAVGAIVPPGAAGVGVSGASGVVIVGSLSVIRSGGR